MASDDKSIGQLLDNARLLRQSGEYKKAVQAYRNALQASPESLDALNELGLIHITIGEQPAAIEVFDKAAHSNKAEAYLTTGSFDEAFTTAERGIVVIPNDASLWFKKGRALESLLKIDDAIEAFNNALRFNSDDPDIWKALALCLDALQKWSEVSRAYRIAERLHRKHGENQQADYCKRFAEMAEKSV
jgi:superkiller protein 3